MRNTGPTQAVIRRDQGTTLLELLIAVSLLSLLSVGILYSMRVGVGAMDRTNARFLSNRRVLGVEKALAQQLAGLIPVVTQCVGSGQASGPKVAFFQGEPQAMRFVTNYSLQESARGFPKVLEYGLVPGEDGVGVRLIVNEAPYSGPFSVQGACVGMGTDPFTGGQIVNYVPIQARPDSFILADKLAAVRFIYRMELPPPELERWGPTWLNPAKFPSAIRIEMTPLEPNRSGLQVSTITIPVRMTANPLYPHVD